MYAVIKPIKQKMIEKYGEDLDALITTLEDMIDRWGVKSIATPVINYLLFRLNHQNIERKKPDGRD